MKNFLLLSLVLVGNSSFAAAPDNRGKGLKNPSAWLESVVQNAVKKDAAFRSHMELVSQQPGSSCKAYLPVDPSRSGLICVKYRDDMMSVKVTALVEERDHKTLKDCDAFATLCSFGSLNGCVGIECQTRIHKSHFRSFAGLDKYAVQADQAAAENR